MTSAMSLKDVGAGLFDIGSAVYQNRQTEENQRRAIRENQKSFKNRYLWTMRDMKKAGLNPILAGNLGTGSAASAPTGPGSGLTSNPVTSAMQAKRVNEEIKNMTSQRANLDADTNLKDKQAIVAEETVRQIEATIDQIATNTKSVQYDNVYKEITAAFYENAELAAMLKEGGLSLDKVLDVVTNRLFNRKSKSNTNPGTQRKNRRGRSKYGNANKTIKKSLNKSQQRSRRRRRN